MWRGSRWFATAVFGIGVVCGATVPGDELIRGVVEARAAQGVPALARRADLDAVAARRASAIAALPESRRLADRPLLEDDLLSSGIAAPDRATERIALFTGPDPEARALEVWRRMPEAWSRALDAEVDGIGAAIAEAADGTSVVVAILVWDREPPSTAGVPAELEDRVFAQVQAERARYGVPPLARSAGLDAVARAHSEAMRRTGFVGHLDVEGRHAADRLRDAGIRFRRVLENVHANEGQRDPVGCAVNGWLDSPGHRAAILDPGRLASGVGVAVDDRGGAWFTQLFVEPAP